MSSVESDHNLARVLGQAADIMPGSPLALVGIFVELVRARFRGENAEGLPWVWREDPTPDHAAHNSGTDGATLYIESQLNDDPEARNYRPAILVDKDDTRPQQAVVGNRAGIRISDRLEGFYAIAKVPINLLCISPSRGESAQLGDTAWFHMMATRLLVRQYFDLREVSLPLLGRTQPYRVVPSAKDAWLTPVSFEVELPLRWVTRPIAPLLQEVCVSLATRGDGSVAEGAVRVASVSTRTK